MEEKEQEKVTGKEKEEIEAWKKNKAGKKKNDCKTIIPSDAASHSFTLNFKWKGCVLLHSVYLQAVFK